MRRACLLWFFDSCQGCEAPRRGCLDELSTYTLRPERAVSIKKKLPFLPFGENGGGKPVWRGRQSLPLEDTSHETLML